ncbi:MAG TPA: radical SAM protein, partial [Caulobacteraceae bacterium]
MTDQLIRSPFVSPAPAPLAAGKFADPQLTAKGEPRAHVALRALDTLWLNTGTLCNIACLNCYIDSSPTNDALAYLSLAEATAYLDEIARLGLATREIGFTGGEPFMNPEGPAMIAAALERGFEALVLTNAMQPMRRPRVEAALLGMRARHGDRLTLRVSLDHHTQAVHDAERG